mgnify:CR=1 FL=1
MGKTLSYRFTQNYGSFKDTCSVSVCEFFLVRELWENSNKYLHMYLKEFVHFFRYFFKKASDEFDSGVIMEEVWNNDDILPLWEGKVIGRVKKMDSWGPYWHPGFTSYSNWFLYRNGVSFSYPPRNGTVVHLHLPIHRFHLWDCWCFRVYVCECRLYLKTQVKSAIFQKKNWYWTFIRSQVSVAKILPQFLRLCWCWYIIIVLQFSIKLQLCKENTSY